MIKYGKIVAAWPNMGVLWAVHMDMPISVNHENTALIVTHTCDALQEGDLSLNTHRSRLVHDYLTVI